MDIFLIRHAKAYALGEQGIDNDEDRPLTEEGKQQSHLLGAALRQHGVVFDVLISTPLLRARQTAEILLQAWPDQTPELQIVNKLTPPCKSRKLTRFLRDLHKTRVGVVGHQPDLGNWAATLIGSKKANIDFAKAGTAHIYWDSEIRKGDGALVWLITPRWYMEQNSTSKKSAAG